MELRQRCAGEPPAPVDERVHEGGIEFVEHGGDEGEVLVLEGSVFGVLVDERPVGVAHYSTVVVGLERGRESEQHTLSGPLGWLISGWGAFPRLKSFNHPASSQPSALAIQQAARASKVANQRNAAVLAGDEHTASIEADCEYVAVPVAVDRFEASVVVGATVEQSRDPTLAARELDAANLHRSKQPGNCRRCGDCLRYAEVGSGSAGEPGDIVPNHVSLECKPGAGCQVGCVEYPAALSVEVLKFRPVEEPVVERPRQHVGSVLAADGPPYVANQLGLQ